MAAAHDDVLVRVIPTDPARAVQLPWSALRACSYFAEQEIEIDFARGAAELHLPFASADDLAFVAAFLEMHARVPLPKLARATHTSSERLRPYDVVPPRFMNLVYALTPYDMMRMATSGFGAEGDARGLIQMLECEPLTALIAARVSRLIWGRTSEEAHAILQYPRALTEEERRFFARDIRWPASPEAAREEAEPDDVRDYLRAALATELVVTGVVQNDVLTLDGEGAADLQVGMVLAACDVVCPVRTIARALPGSVYELEPARGDVAAVRSRFFIWQPYSDWRARAR